MCVYIYARVIQLFHMYKKATAIQWHTYVYCQHNDQPNWQQADESASHARTPVAQYAHVSRQSIVIWLGCKQ